MHKCAKEGHPLSEEEVLHLVDQRFHLRYTRDGEVFKPFTELKNAAKLSIQRYLKQYPSNLEYVLDAEKPFEYIDRECNVLISGTVDLLERIEKTLSGEVRTPIAIVDFKTHRWREFEEFEKSKLAAESQLRLYSLAIGEALEYSVKNARVHFLSPTEIPPDSELAQRGASEIIQIQLSESGKKETRKMIRDTIRKIRASIDNKEFELRYTQKVWK
jgi:DNA helicase-2/ATP-dependent DNA helicase PcrA